MTVLGALLERRRFQDEKCKFGRIIDEAEFSGK